MLEFSQLEQSTEHSSAQQNESKPIPIKSEFVLETQHKYNTFGTVILKRDDVKEETIFNANRIPKVSFSVSFHTFSPETLEITLDARTHSSKKKMSFSLECCRHTESQPFYALTLYECFCVRELLLCLDKYQKIESARSFFATAFFVISNRCVRNKCDRN